MKTSQKISIITPSFNQGEFISQTISSVMNQNIKDVEHIVVDGGSTDSTVSVLESFPHIKWISEKDEGQADALTKGFKMVTGDIIGWVNSDDYYEENVFKKVLECFQDPEVNWVIGNLTYQYDMTGELIKNASPEVSFESLAKNPDIVRQQPTFFRKSFIEKVGGWSPQFYMIMDFDLWIRMAKISKPLMVDENWAYFRFHGDQKTSLPNIIRQRNEMLTVLKREGVSPVIRYKLGIKKRWHWFKASIKSRLISNGFLDSKYEQRSVRQR